MKPLKEQLLICTRQAALPNPVGDAVMSDECSECKKQIWVTGECEMVGGPVLVCAECSVKVLAPGEYAVGVDVHLDDQLMAVQNEHQAFDLVSVATRNPTGLSSPRWVTCPKCQSWKGDQCRTGLDYCEERVMANKERLLALDTWAWKWRPDCCKPSKDVWLAWRGAEDALKWECVPCFVCGSQHVVERFASDLVPDRVLVDRLNPHLVEMTCWASENSEPWEIKKPEKP